MVEVKTKDGSETSIANDLSHDLDPTAHPGELTFEEGAGNPLLVSLQNLTDFFGRRCWRNGTTSWSIQLYDVDVRSIFVCLSLILPSLIPVLAV